MERTLSTETKSKISEAITLKGWVNSRRDHGGLIFIDLRDHTGVTQLVFQPEFTEAFATAEQLRDEFVISARGVVKERADGLKNPNIESGDIEVVVSEVLVLNKSAPLPIQIQGEDQSSEESRLKYRYLDLRRPKMQNMLKKRAELFGIMRQYMDNHEFTEVTTPVLANSSPEGARDFLVPSRLQNGKYYALPQSPQQFKQLLMVGGVSRYYQMATCFRDEDPRADRLYGEFYHLDTEMSFVDDGQIVRDTMEPLITSLVTDFAGKRIVGNEVVTITHTEAMEKYGSDKPDLRYGMELIELTDVFEGTEFGVFKNAPVIKAICVKGGASLSRSQIDNFTGIAKSEGAGGLAYITYENGEVKSPIIKFFSDTELAEVKKRLSAEDGDAIFFGADTRQVVNKVLGKLRTCFADHFELKNPDEISLVWIVDFPFYEWDDKAKKVDFGHNPFSMPKGGVEALKNAKTDDEKLAIVADQYDMAMNGYEICSGAVRNHNPEVMYEAFGILGYDRNYVDAKFGAMINAFKYGAPPHAGCAFGIDRMFMELMGESNIREVVAFPKNGSGVDVMMNSPSEVESSQLKELGIINNTKA
ncbi:aspartate--tRNA ligase [Candidatus Saccharibacteria bacterium]|nr:aspartate--tRNA ligase [Candidatus Saccharibacteria bacterium]